MTATMGTMTSGRMRLSGTSLTLVSYSTRPNTHSREPNFTCIVDRCGFARTHGCPACPPALPPSPRLAQPGTRPTRTHDELRQVVCRVSLLPPFGRGLHLRGLAVQVRLGQRLHDAALSAHEGLGLVKRHRLVQISALGVGGGAEVTVTRRASGLWSWGRLPRRPRAVASPHPGMDELVDLLLDAPREVLKGGVGHVLKGTGLGPEQGAVPVHLDERREIVGLGLLGDRRRQEDHFGVVVEHVLRAHNLQAEAGPSGHVAQAPSLPCTSRGPTSEPSPQPVPGLTVVGCRGPASRLRRQDCKGSAMTTMANLWIRLKPCPVTLMLRPPLGTGGGQCLSGHSSASQLWRGCPAKPCPQQLPLPSGGRAGPRVPGPSVQSVTGAGLCERVFAARLSSEHMTMGTAAACQERGGVGGRGACPSGFLGGS